MIFVWYQFTTTKRITAKHTSLSIIMNHQWINHNHLQICIGIGRHHLKSWVLRPWVHEAFVIPWVPMSLCPLGNLWTAASSQARKSLGQKGHEAGSFFPGSAICIEYLGFCAAQCGKSSKQATKSRVFTSNDPDLDQSMAAVGWELTELTPLATVCLIKSLIRNVFDHTAPQKARQKWKWSV